MEDNEYSFSQKLWAPGFFFPGAQNKSGMITSCFNYSPKSIIISASFPHTEHTRVSLCFFLTTFGDTGTSTSSQVMVISASLPHFSHLHTSRLSVIVPSPLELELRFLIPGHAELFPRSHNIINSFRKQSGTSRLDRMARSPGLCRLLSLVDSNPATGYLT